MATITIDGVGDVEVDDGFLKLPPEKQAAEVDQFVKMYSGGPAPESRGMTEEEMFLKSIEQNNPKPDELAARGSILPIGRTKEGDITLALPGFLEGPRKTIMDLIDGRRTADQISGKEFFELGSLLAGAPAGSASLGLQGVKSAPAAAGTVDDALRAAVPEPPTAAPPPVAAAADDAALTAAAPAAKALASDASTKEIKGAAQSLYQQMDDAGVTIAPRATRQLVDDVRKAVDETTFDRDLHPGAAAALKRIDAIADQPLTFKKLDILRQIAKEVGGSPKAGERKIAGVIIEKIDDMVARLSDSDVIAGEPKVAAESVIKARHLWSKAAKLDRVAELVERARLSAPNFSGSGMENALRTEFRILAKNKREMRTYTSKEQTAIKKIATGRKISRSIGKFAPTGVVSTVMSGGAGHAIGGPVGAIALPAAGFAARQLATFLVRRHVSQLEEVIRSGGGSITAERSLARARATLQSIAEETAKEAAKQSPRSVASGAADTRTRR